VKNLFNKNLNPTLLKVFLAYSNGYFPMGENKNNDEIQWVKPKNRGIIPIGKLHCSKSLKKFIKKNDFNISFDKNFNDVIFNCANRKTTWINSTIYELFLYLFSQGFAHSVEVKKKETLVGGLYGLSFGSIFFAESMFSIIPNTSKIALIAMMAKINYGGYKVFDTQFPSEHLASLGGLSISEDKFKKKLSYTFDTSAEFDRIPQLNNWEEFLEYGTNN
tara:strand:+ start:59 stop:715 length:657 start_codon:yes stop_codon:yes gene_type:complete